MNFQGEYELLKRIFLPLMLSLCCALLLAACGGTDTATNTNTTTTTNKSTTTSPNSNTTSTTTTTTTSSTDKIGIADCDDFIAKYEACINAKVPEAARAQYKSSLEAWRKQWRDLAGNPQTKASLAAACKTAAEQTKASMKTFGCEF